MQARLGADAPYVTQGNNALGFSANSGFRGLQINHLSAPGAAIGVAMI